MPSPFARTTRALAADGHARAWLWIALATILIAAWVAWSVLARISVYAETENARIEVRSATHVVQPAVRGKVIAVHAVLGDTVDAGDVLFELDSESSRLALDRARVRKAAVLQQIASIRQQIAVGTATEAVRRGRAGRQEHQSETTNANAHAA